MVVGGMMCHGDLVTGAECQSHSAVNRNTSDDQSGCYEELILAGFLAQREPGVVELEFRPKISHHAILECGVPVERHRESIHPAVGNRNADGALKIEVAESLTERDGRRVDRMAGAVAVVAGRYLEAHES